MALLLVLGAVAVLASVSSALHRTSLAEARLAHHQSYRARAAALARTGVEVAKLLLLKDVRPYTWFPRYGEGGAVPTRIEGGEVTLSDLEEAMLLLSEGGPVPYELDGGVVQVTLEDEAGRLNLNRMPGDHFTRLLQVLGAGYEAPEDFLGEEANKRALGLAQVLEDWRDRDDDTRGEGAETAQYEKLGGLGYRARDEALQSAQELAYLKGFTPELLYGSGGGGDVGQGGARLVDQVSVHGVLARVNANSASRVVLASLPGIFESPARAELVERVVGMRPYPTRQALQQAIEVVDPEAAGKAVPWLDVRGDYIRVRAVGILPGRARATREVVIRRQPGPRLQVVAASEGGR